MLFYIFISIWLSILLFIIAKLCKNIIDVIKLKILIKSDYSEEKIISHLNYMINECIDQYVLLNLTANNMYHIDSNTQEKIIEYITNSISMRLSDVLISKLNLIYNSNHIGDIIGEHIYMQVTDYVLNYNLNSSEYIAKKVSNAIIEKS